MKAEVPLTARQRQVCAYLAEGCSDKEIATALGISESTVDHHLRKLFAKFGAHSRCAAAVAYAVRKRSYRRACSRGSVMA